MIRKIRQRNRVEITTNFREFSWTDGKGGGFMFPADESGNVKLAEMQPAARNNYAKCLSGEYAVTDDGVRSFTHSYIEPAIGECEECGAHVTLAGFTNECDCGADYNMSGQRLAPRSQWGEETGESLVDILRIP